MTRTAALMITLIIPSHLYRFCGLKKVWCHQNETLHLKWQKCLCRFKHLFSYSIFRLIFTLEVASCLQCFTLVAFIVSLSSFCTTSPQQRLKTEEGQSEWYIFTSFLIDVWSLCLKERFYECDVMLNTKTLVLCLCHHPFKRFIPPV